jgi:hypothetical protein
VSRKRTKKRGGRYIRNKEEKEKEEDRQKEIR